MNNSAAGPDFFIAEAAEGAEFFLFLAVSRLFLGRGALACGEFAAEAQRADAATSSSALSAASAMK